MSAADTRKLYDAVYERVRQLTHDHPPIGGVPNGCDFEELMLCCGSTSVILKTCANRKRAITGALRTLRSEGKIHNVNKTWRVCLPSHKQQLHNDNKLLAVADKATSKQGHLPRFKNWEPGSWRLRLELISPTGARLKLHLDKLDGPSGAVTSQLATLLALHRADTRPNNKRREQCLKELGELLADHITLQEGNEES